MEIEQMHICSLEQLFQVYRQHQAIKFEYDRLWSGLGLCEVFLLSAILEEDGVGGFSGRPPTSELRIWGSGW